MITHIGPSGISITVATISGCPHSTAASTANAAASSSNGTSSVASITGRPRAPIDETSSRVARRRRVSMPLLGVKLPAGGASRRQPRLPPPPRQVQEEPGRRHDRSHEDEGRVHDDDQRNED